VFTYVHFARAVGGTRTVCERLPCAPAVYAWFRAIDLPLPSGSEDFVESILRLIATPAAPEHRARLGPLHSVVLESGSRLSRSKLAYLSSLAENETLRRYISLVVRRASLLQSPLYVGKARDLQQRTEQHLSPMSELAVRLRAANIDLATCTLCYTVVEDIGDDPEGHILTFVEELLTHICRPGFVLRPG
jgi:hypothetical protein